MAEGELLGTILRLTLALVAGGLVGLERSYHGRPAGFREHTLVCISSCMLMLLAEYHVIHIAAANKRNRQRFPGRRQGAQMPTTRTCRKKCSSRQQ